MPVYGDLDCGECRSGGEDSHRDVGTLDKVGENRLAVGSLGIKGERPLFELSCRR